MGARGPKSKAELAALPTPIKKRPKPPRRLDRRGRARWREIVGELPAGRFRASDLKMLEDMIVTEKYIAGCDDSIREHGQIIGPGARVNPATELRNKHVGVLVKLQRALRLCPSMRMRQEDGKPGKHRPAGKKPWEKN